MGFPATRVKGFVDDEVLCSICQDILRDPVQTPCEHAFCRVCIHTWLRSRSICPVDREKTTLKKLKPASRLLKNLLSRLEFTCENAQYGCTDSIKYDSLLSHPKLCIESLAKAITCERGCGLQVVKRDQKDHDCITALRTTCQSQTRELEKLKANLFQSEISRTTETKNIEKQTKQIDHLREILREFQSLHTKQSHTVQSQSQQIHELRGKLQDVKSRKYKKSDDEEGTGHPAKKKKLDNFTSKIQIFVKMSCMTGKTIILKVDPSCRILNVKTLIENNEGIPTGRQRISLGTGVDLVDDKTLADYNVMEGSTLYCRIRHGASGYNPDRILKLLTGDD